MAGLDPAIQLLSFQMRCPGSPVQGPAMTMINQDHLLFVPLGGCGEIGMNLTLYGFGPEGGEKWIIADLGVTFGHDDTPGIEVIMPDPAFIEERRRDLLGIVLTHGHEDHIGAVPYLWRRLKCPVYATPFTAVLVRGKLIEAGLEEEVKIIEVPLNGRIKLGPFDIRYVTLTHSILEPNALAIKTPLGMILHTGDWKIDPGADDGRGDRRSHAHQARRRRRARHGVRFHQRVRARRIGLRRLGAR